MSAAARQRAMDLIGAHLSGPARLVEPGKNMPARPGPCQVFSHDRFRPRTSSLAAPIAALSPSTGVTILCAVTTARDSRAGGGRVVDLLAMLRRRGA